MSPAVVEGGLQLLQAAARPDVSWGEHRMGIIAHGGEDEDLSPWPMCVGGSRPAHTQLPAIPLTSTRGAVARTHPSRAVPVTPAVLLNLHRSSQAQQWAGQPQRRNAVAGRNRP